MTPDLRCFIDPRVFIFLTLCQSCAKEKSSGVENGHSSVFIVNIVVFVLFKVQNIKRPESYEKVVRSKEAAKENIKIAENQRPREMVEARTNREEARTQAQITIQRAESSARVILSQARAEADSIRAAYQAETQAFLKLKQDALNSTAGLLSYLGVRVISENNNTINIAIDAPAKTKYTYV